MRPSQNARRPLPPDAALSAALPALFAAPALAALILSSGCGAKPTAPATPEAPPPVESAAAAPEPAPKAEAKGRAAFPTSCSGEGKDPCVPPPDFVKQICEKPLGDLALALFQKDSPFTRGYLTREVDGWNASGGGSSREKVPFDEEVLLLRVRAEAKGAMQMSGQGGYDVLRWDGSCISLATEELTQKRPPRGRHAAIPFRYLSEKTQLSLLANEKIKNVYEARRKECKGVTTGDVSAKCEKLDKELSVVIVDFVRNGGKVPRPE